MNRLNILGMVAAPLLIANGAFAGGPTHEECPVSKKVSGLLTSWESATAEAQGMSEEAKKQCKSKIAAVAQKCPVGCRMGDTLSAVRDALGIVVASQEANAKHCPLNKSEAESASCAKAKELKAARTHVLTNLHKLASYSACATSDKSKSAARCATKSAGYANCPIRTAARIGELRQSFAAAKKEVESLSAETRNELQVAFASLTETNKIVALVPESVAALTEGLQALNHIHTEMAAWAESNPEFMSSVPVSVHQSYMMEVALIEEAQQLLASVGQTMQHMQSLALESASASAN